MNDRDETAIQMPQGTEVDVPDGERIRRMAGWYEYEMAISRDDEKIPGFVPYPPVPIPADLRRIADKVDQDPALRDAIEMAWGIIANAGGGDWTRETAEWQEAAARWRDSALPLIAPSPLRPASDGGTVAASDDV